MMKLSDNREQDIEAILSHHDHADKLQLFVETPLSVKEIEKFFKWHLRIQIQVQMEWELYQYIDELLSHDDTQQAYKDWLIDHNNAAIETSWKAAQSVE